MSQFPPSAPPPSPPPPPPGGSGAYGGNQPAEAVAAIKYGWEKFQQNWQVILTALIVGFVAIATLGIIGILIQQALTSVDNSNCRFTQNGLSGCETGPGIVTTFIAAGIFQLLFFLGTTILQLFVIRATLMIIRGEKLEASRVMSMENVGNYFLTALLVGVLTFVGLILCVLPGIAVMFFSMFWGYFVVDKNMKPVEAITASFNLVKANVGPVIIFLLLSWVVTFAGLIACIVGLIVAIPVVTIATGYMYKRLQNEPVAA